MKMKKLALASGIGLLAGMTTVAHAVTPAGTIRNTAQLTYAGLVTPLQATVDVTVTLVPAIPTLTNSTADQTVATNAGVSYTYVITSNANGPETTTLDYGTDVITGLLTGNTASNGPATVLLGSTSAALAAPIGTVIKVPDDFLVDNANVNGLTAGDTVVIAGAEYTIATVTQEAGDAVAGLLTITLTAPLAAPISAGDQLFERQNVVVSISDVGAPSGTITSNLSGTTPGVGPIIDVTAVTTVTSPAFEKWVRNTTNDNNNGLGTFTTDCGTASATYYDTASGVTAVGNDVLEYCIQVIPASDITGANLSDTIPAYTTYISGVQFGATTAAVSEAALAAGVLIQSASGAVAGEVDATEKAGVVFSVTVQN